MLDGFAADPAAIDGAASRLSGTADSIKGLDVAGPFGPVAEALPGSRSAPASVWVSSRLGAAAMVYGDHVRELSTAAKPAASYRTTDQAVAARMGGMPR